LIDRSQHVTNGSLDPIRCGAEYCGAHGQCDYGSHVCRCDAEYTGDHCEYSVADYIYEKEGLKELFLKTSGFHWIDVTGWFAGEDYCEFKGVTCNQWGFVVAIELPFNNLRGVLPNSLNAFKQLRVLDLSGNFLTGSIPSALFQMPLLKELDLSRNLLSGMLSADIQQLASLRRLDLSGNQLYGELPWSLGNMKGLEVLHLQRNQFWGSLPFSIVNLGNVSSIDLTNNQFDASANLPGSLCVQCERFINQCHRYGCPNCKDGQLLSCHNPNSFTLTPNLSGDRVDTHPEECGYHFG